MTESKYLANRLQEVLLTGKWIAKTNIQEQLDKLNFEQANFKLGDHNTIAELTYHINYYLGGILNVLNGDDLDISDEYSFEMNRITSEDEWRNLVKSYKDNSRLIVEKVENFPDYGWNEPFVKKVYGTYKRNIEGLIEHSYYHFGQISLLLKLIEK